MTDPVRRDGKPSIPDDESAIRERSASTPPTGASSNSARPSASVSAGATRDRLEQKIRRGRALLQTLPASDDRARLLSVAIMRRDESLLDGVLASLGAKDSVPPSR